MQCGEAKALADFHRRTASPDGLQPKCKICTLAASAARYRILRQDPEFLAKANEASKRWQAANPEKKAAAQQRRAEANREKQRRVAREWRDANPEKAAAAGRKWAASNPDKIRRYAAEKRVGRKNKLGVEYATAVLMFDPCSFCGGQTTEIEHIHPRKRGGSDDWWNLTASCRSCNASKRTASLLEYLLRR